MSSHKALRSILGIMFVDQAAFTIGVPLLTLIFFDPHSRLFPASTPASIRSAYYGLCISLPFFINIFFAPVLSMLSDVYGRKRILLIEIFGGVTFALGAALGIMLGSIGLIFLSQLIRGAFSRTNPTALTIIGDVAPPAKKLLYMSYLQFAVSSGATLGPFIGGYLADKFFHTFNFALPFFVAAALAITNSLFTFFYMDETLRQRPSKTSYRAHFQSIKNVFLAPAVLRISLILMLIQISWSTYYQFMPPTLKTLYGFNSHELGLFVGMIAFWLAVASSIGMKLLDQFFSLRQILTFAICLVLAGLAVTTIAIQYSMHSSSFLIWAGAIPIAAGDVLAYSCLTSMYSNVVAHAAQGKVMGVVFIVTGTVWASTSILGGILMSHATLLPLFVTPISSIIALGLMRTPLASSLFPQATPA
jgi:MFS family permease